MSDLLISDNPSYDGTVGEYARIETLHTLLDSDEYKERRSPYDIVTAEKYT